MRQSGRDASRSAKSAQQNLTEMKFAEIKEKYGIDVAVLVEALADVNSDAAQAALDQSGARS